MQRSHRLLIKVQARENALSITLIYTPIATVLGKPWPLNAPAFANTPTIDNASETG